MSQLLKELLDLEIQAAELIGNALSGQSGKVKAPTTRGMLAQTLSFIPIAAGSKVPSEQAKDPQNKQPKPMRKNRR